MRRREQARRGVYLCRAARRRRALKFVIVAAALAALVAMLAGGGSETIAFDRAAAARYADSWALSANPAYWVSPDGADCANFVSQCLAAGRLRPLDDPDGRWHANGTDFPTVSWCNCGAQKAALSRETSSRTPCIASCTSGRPRGWARGDIVYLGARVNGRVVWQHVIICVGREHGEWVYDSHTKAHRREPISTWYPAHFELICYCHIPDTVTYR